MSPIPINPMLRDKIEKKPIKKGHEKNFSQLA
jgi:hypothetical protein